ncbi:unnamed protein product, partial [Prorocentrum cordatum]
VECDALETVLMAGSKCGRVEDMEKALENWPRMNFAKAMAAYPVGRAILEDVEKNGLPMMKTRVKNIDSWRKFAVGSPTGEVILNMNGIIQRVDIIGDDAAMEDAREAVKRLHYLSSASSLNNFCAAKMPGHPICSCVGDLHVELHDLALFMFEYEGAADVPNPSEPLASSILLGLSNFGGQKAVVSALGSLVGDGPVQLLSDWFARAWRSESVSKCVETCKAQAAGLEAAAKTAIKDTFEMKIAVDDAAFPKLLSFNLPGDVPAAIGVLRSIPRQSILVGEIQCTYLYGRVAKNYAKSKSGYEKLETKKERTISETLVGMISGLRGDLKTFRDFVAASPVSEYFRSGPLAVDEQLLQTEKSRLKVEWDRDDLDKALNTIEAWIAAVAQGWIQDGAGPE